MIGTDPDLLTPLPLDERLSQCSVCGSKSWTLAYAPDVNRCLRCSTLFREPRPTQTVIAASYDRGHTYAEWQKKGDSWNALWNRRIAYVKRLQGSGRMLDIGVGDASFLKRAQTEGYTAEGTELSQTGASYAEGHSLTIRVGQFTDLPFKPGLFDIITMWHVLEHVPNPQDVVRKIFSLLRPGGFFVLAVPNESHPLIRHRVSPSRFPQPFGRLVWGGEIHLTHFTPATLKAFLRREGFRIERFEVDDFYPNRSIRDRLKFGVHQSLARVVGWHCAAAMQVVCRK